MWGVYFCLASSGFFYFLNQFAATGINPALEWFFAISLATTAYILAAIFCSNVALHLSGHEKYRFVNRKWIVIGGLLTIVIDALSTILEGGYRSLPAIGGVVSAAYLLITISRYVIPAFYLAYKNEKQKPMRLRMLLMIATQVGIALWMVNSIFESFSVVVALQYNNREIVYRIITIILVPSFILAHLMPNAYFIWLVSCFNYWSNLLAFQSIRGLENTARRLANSTAAALSLREIMLTPGVATYRCVISIFDIRKDLMQNATPQARLISEQLSQCARPDWSYEEVVVYLTVTAKLLARLPNKETQRAQ
jgi:hypothetical protein